MIVIAFASGQNGMTTWCIEAAYALQENGIEYCLFCDEKVNLEPHSTLKTYIIKDSFTLPNSFWGKFKVQIWDRIFRSNTVIAQKIHQTLKKEQITISHIIWNNAVFIDAQLPIPQYVVAWSYPSDLFSYIKKISTLFKNQNLKNKLFCILDTLGFYLSDRQGYKKSEKILAIHEALNIELQNKKLNSFLIYPCIQSKSNIITKHNGDKLKILITALYLEEPRKGIDWMLNNLIDSEFIKKIELHLIGNCSSEFKSKYSDCLPITFHGVLARTDVENHMKEMDLFLFGSSLDDWGFVQTEALSNGLIVISPNLTPFNEIVPISQLLFELNSKESFLDAIHFVLNSNLLKLKNICLNSINEKFSREIFAKKIAQNLLGSKN